MNITEKEIVSFGVFLGSLFLTFFFHLVKKRFVFYVLIELNYNKWGICYIICILCVYVRTYIVKNEIIKMTICARQVLSKHYNGVYVKLTLRNSSSFQSLWENLSLIRMVDLYLYMNGRHYGRRYGNIPHVLGKQCV